MQGLKFSGSVIFELRNHATQLALNVVAFLLIRRCFAAVLIVRIS